MAEHNKRLLTIITEALLERKLEDELHSLGVKGYTIVEARGRGHRGLREASWDGGNNIRIDVVCDHDTAEKVAQHLQENYYADYAMVLFASDVTVLRPDKF